MSNRPVNLVDPSGAFAEPAANTEPATDEEKVVRGIWVEVDVREGQTREVAFENALMQEFRDKGLEPIDAVVIAATTKLGDEKKSRYDVLREQEGRRIWIPEATLQRVAEKVGKKLGYELEERTYAGSSKGERSAETDKLEKMAKGLDNVDTAMTIAGGLGAMRALFTALLKKRAKQKVTEEAAEVVGREVDDTVRLADDIADDAARAAAKGGVDDLLANELSEMSRNEAEKLLRSWDASTFDTLAESLRYHAGKHGFENDMAKYLRKASDFNKKGARKKLLEDGATRWTRKNGEFLIERNGKIVSYGLN